MTIIHEQEVPEVECPGRFMRWLVSEESLKAKNLSVCVIRVLPGESVKPAHSHPNSEELIYIISGSGMVLIEGEVEEVRSGSAILFEQGKIHMLKNTGDMEMKVICFFAPATNISNYKTFEAINFPE